MSRHVSIRSLLLVVLATGCTGYIEAAGGLADLPPDQAAAQALWEARALPILKTGTMPACVECHDGRPDPPVAGGPAYLAGGDDLGVRSTILGFNPEIVTLTGDPTSSLLLTKQAHEGPPLFIDQTTSILDWIKAEAKAKASGN